MTSFAYVGIGLLLLGAPAVGHPWRTRARSSTPARSCIPLVAICACVVGMAAVSTRLAIAVVAINALFVLVLYTPSLTPLPGTEYSPIAAILAAFGLVGYALVAFGGVPLRLPLSGDGRGSWRGATET